MEEIILTSKEEISYSPDLNYKDISEFLTGYSKNNINLKNIINSHPNLKKITFKNLSRDVVEHLIIIDVNYPNIKVELKDCEFASILIRNTSVKELNIQGPSEEIENVRYHSEGITIQQDVKIEILWISLTANIESINISGEDTSINKFGLRSLKNLKGVYVDAKINALQFDNDPDNKIDTINLIRSQINYLELHNIKYSDFYIDTEWMFKNESIYEGNSAIINNIKIINSTFPQNFKLISNLISLKNVFLEKCTFKSLTINHKNANIKIDDCIIEEKLTIGSESTEANSSKFEITNNTITKGIFFGKHRIKDEFKIERNRLESGSLEFYGFSLDEYCNSKLTKQLFKGATFQNCDFSNFDFKDTSIHLAEIINPKWKEVDIDGQKRILFKGDNEALKEKEDIDKLKKQYSYFRKKFENENSYEVSSKFKISEALTRIKLLKAEKSSRRHLLKFSKWLNLFGESITRPAIGFILVLFSFTVLYLFSGFEIKNGNVPVCVDYNFHSFDINKIFSKDCSDLKNYGHAFVFSLKNIVPIKLESDFYLSADSKFRWTQMLSMFQKLLNIIIIGALFTSIRNFFRK